MLTAIVSTIKHHVHVVLRELLEACECEVDSGAILQCAILCNLVLHIAAYRPILHIYDSISVSLTIDGNIWHINKYIGTIIRCLDPDFAEGKLHDRVVCDDLLGLACHHHHSRRE